MPSHESHDQSDGDGPVDTDGRVAQWVAEAATGDQDAWRALVEAYARRVFGLLRSQGCDPARAEEITQSVFVTVARVVGRGQYDEQGRFDAWIFRVAMNRLRDDARTRKRRATYEMGDEAEAVHLAAASAPSEQDHSGLHEALAGLAPADREVIELRHRANMSFKQIAEVLGQPLGTVLARHHRALRKLRATLEGASKSTA
ncbi:MAG: RNA polymerase sigma factor [Phycisphaerales bacterium]